MDFKTIEPVVPGRVKHYSVDVRYYIKGRRKQCIKTHDFYSPSELYLLSDCHSSVNFSANFCG
jgi:hypothetical protein